jgi:diguanylate cyclase (GGDEF)-like protein
MLGAPLSVVAIVIGLVLAASHQVVRDETIGNVTFAIVAVSAVASVIIGIRLNRPELPGVWWGFAAMAASFAVSTAGLGLWPSSGLAFELLDVLGYLLMIATLGFVLNRRRSGGARNVIADGVIVAFGTWLVTLVTLVEPSIHASGLTFSTVITHLYQPFDAVLAFLLLWLVFTDAFRAPAMWIMATAIGLEIVIDVLYGLNDLGRLTLDDRTFESFYLIAYALLGAVALHPSMRTLTEHRVAAPNRNPTTRTVLTSPMLLLAVSIAVFGHPVGTSVRIARGVSVLLLVAAVLVRSLQAHRSSERAQALLLHNARHDALTSLPNRTFIAERITELLHHSWRSRSALSVLYLDLDRFQQINDSLGHDVADDVLRIVAGRLRGLVGPNGTVARTSGDEFIVVMPELESAGDALELADRVLSSFHEPVPVPAGDVFLTTSVGVVYATSTWQGTAEDLLRNADTAVYRAKEAGRNCAALFDESMHDRVARRLEMETALRRAVERRELRLYHQPIIDLRTGSITGFEALLRWERDNGAIVSPIEFIGIAEDTGMIVPIGNWVMLEALVQLRTWIDHGVCHPDATMSINVSPRQLRDHSLLAVVTEALARSAVPPSNLMIEITETVMMEDTEAALAVLERLISLGVGVALDDFGTGHSSLSQLKRFPINRIKIDRSFVAGLDTNDRDRSLVRTIIAMARTLDKDLVAEGVETIEQLVTLAELGCGKAQGYFFSKPLPPEHLAHVMPGIERAMVAVDLADVLRLDD